MIDGLSKRVLNAINELAKDGNKRINSINILDKMGDKDHKLYTDVYQCMWYLKENGYIVMSSDHGVHSNVTALHKGRMHKNFGRMETRQFIRRSILVPIAVAFVTTGLTNYIVPKFPLMLQWLSNILS